MPIVLLLVACVAAVWAWVIGKRVSLSTAVAVLLVVGYVFGHAFWHLDIGPAPLTLDRLMLMGIVGLAGWRVWQGKIVSPPLAGADWALAGCLVWMTLSFLLSKPDETVPQPTSIFWRLLIAFWVPAILYTMQRCAPVSPRDSRWVLWIMAGLGSYLAATALAETAGAWWAVYPKFIADPEQGLHFGRARGPALNSVSMGSHLAVCLWAAWLLVRGAARPARAGLIAAAGLMALGVLLTYTRSTWIGLGLSGLVIAWLQTSRRLRLPVFGLACVAGAALTVAAWDKIVGLQREDSGNVSAHSVQQRESFLYVSMQMFQDYPLWGVGFGRFYDMKLPYLSDRRQTVELESIRGLHHHNTYLGLLTETGLVGLALYFGLLAGVGVCGWRLATASDAAPDHRALGQWLVATLAVYVPNAAFHDVTHIHPEQWLLFAVAGLAVGCERRLLLQRQAPFAASPQPSYPPAIHRAALAGISYQTDFMEPRPLPTLATAPLFGMQIHRLTLDQAAKQVLTWASSESQGACKYVVTPNVDHAVMFQERPDLRAAYSDASLVLADGAPIVAAARLLGRALPERVAGSDLAPRLFDLAQSDGAPLTVFLLGAAPGVAARAAKRIEAHWPRVRVVGVSSPPLGFDNDPAICDALLAEVAAAKPDVLLLGLGAPKQELWIHKHAPRIQAKTALCIGATIDFLAGERQRAPRWMQQTGTEWLHRLASEPKRLAKRYARDARIFPMLVVRELLGGFRAGGEGRYT